MPPPLVGKGERERERERERFKKKKKKLDDQAWHHRRMSELINCSVQMLLCLFIV